MSCLYLLNYEENDDFADSPTRLPALGLTLKFGRLSVSRGGFELGADRGKCGVEERPVVFAGNFTGGECVVRLVKAGVTVLYLILCHPLVSQDHVLLPDMYAMGTAPKILESVEPCSLSPSSVQYPSGT